MGDEDAKRPRLKTAAGGVPVSATDAMVALHDHKIYELAKDVETMVAKLEVTNDLLRALEKDLAVVGTERKAERDRAVWWSKILSAVCIAIVLTAGGILFRVAMVVQTNRLSP